MTIECFATVRSTSITVNTSTINSTCLVIQLFKTQRSTKSIVLHNFLLEQNDEAPVDWMDVSRDDDDDEEEPDGADRNIQPNQLHDQKRQELRDYIADYYVY